jgi:hypothetical protein
MLCTEVSIDIDRPVGEVFAFLTDIERRPLVTSTVREETLAIPGPLHAGSRFTQRIDLFGRVFDATLEVIECDPPRRFAYQTAIAPFPFTIYYYLTPVGISTHLSLVLEGEPGTFFGLSGLTLVMLIKRQLHNDLEKVREFLEVWQVVEA